MQIIQYLYRFYFSPEAGTGTLVQTKTLAEVTNISPNGIWILANDKEYFISYKDYPVFETATIREIAAVTTDFSGNLHWEELDADIELESLEYPEKYPLIYR
ncbi:MAG: DUF2442 domain-containing protein [Treponema sp.]|nr:DUF2442 domain-containing protein [Spirochaetia bacterium]MDD7014688.1 DUF2442 domain-containing protein [Spirochaetales bacterium]MDY4902482.1 DUF2442 domain-containing protein [Treponema sp.]